MAILLNIFISSNIADCTAAECIYVWQYPIQYLELRQHTIENTILSIEQSNYQENQSKAHQIVLITRYCSSEDFHDLIESWSVIGQNDKGSTLIVWNSPLLLLVSNEDTWLHFMVLHFLIHYNHRQQHLAQGFK